jgi:biopolymer transport protein ExbD
MRFAPRRRESAEINLTPLIDILFLVLVFLVVTATFSDRTVLRISLPPASSAESLGKESDALLIVIDAGGTVYVDGMAQSLDAVSRRLDALQNKDMAPVTVAADERTPHGRVIQVVDLIRQAGLFRLDIQTFSGGSVGQ